MTELNTKRVEAAAERLHLNFRSVEAQRPDQIARAFAVEQPTKFDFVINLKIAKTLGINIPDSIQLLADKLIE